MEDRSNLFVDAPVVFSYTRAQAIADGVLVDVSSTPEHAAAGFRLPLALTAAAFHDCVTAPSQHLAAATSSPLARLLGALYRAIAAASPTATRVAFQFSSSSDDRSSDTVALYAVIDGGEDGQPVLTLLLEGED